MELSEINQKIKNIRAERTTQQLPELGAKEDPFQLFLSWFNQALEVESTDPSAMVLATIDEKGLPDARVVLLKELEEHRFVFYTSYASKKAKDLAHQDVAALNFYWPDLFCQIRIRGRVEKITRKKSELYFSTRPREAQLGAHAWVQSSALSSQEELDQRIKLQTEKYANQTVPCPENWGGYALLPFEYEFFQRKQWRRHNRLLYTLMGTTWKIARLAP